VACDLDSEGRQEDLEDRLLVTVGNPHDYILVISVKCLEPGFHNQYSD